MYASQRDFDAFDIVEEAEITHQPALASVFAHQASIPPSRYEGARNWPAIVLIALAHVAAIALLIKFDVLDIAHKRPTPQLIQIAIAPPPPSEPQPSPTARTQTPQETPIVAPPPIASVPMSPAPVVTVPIAPPPPAPVAITAPAAPVIAAPIVPPDASAANLGNVAPRYPIESRRAREEGVVRLRVLISPEGGVEEISVAHSSGYSRLDKAALETVRGWRFRPGTQAGRPVEAVGYLSIPFVLSH